MDEKNIKKIVLICVIILLIYLILRFINRNMYTYSMPMLTTSNVVYTNKNVHYYPPPRMVPHYNAYKAQFYN